MTQREDLDNLKKETTIPFQKFNERINDLNDIIQI